MVREVLGKEDIDAVRTELDNLADGLPARQMVYKDGADLEVDFASDQVYFNHISFLASKGRLIIKSAKSICLERPHAPQKINIKRPVSLRRFFWFPFLFSMILGF